MKLNRCLIALCAILALTSCKLRIVVPEGGSVTTQSGAYSCAAGKICGINIVDFYFDQTFVAMPAEGYEFKYWKKADRRFCGSTSSPCHITTVGTNANEDLAGVMMSFFETNTEIFYLQPLFVKKDSRSASCSLYVPGTLFCDTVNDPICTVTVAQTSQIVAGMSYDQVVGILGCHGRLSVTGSDLAAYYWTGDGGDEIIIMFIYGPESGYSVPSVLQVGAPL